MKQNRTTPSLCARVGKYWILAALGAVALVVAGILWLPGLFANNGIINNYVPPALTFPTESLSPTEQKKEEEKNQIAYEKLFKDVKYTYGGVTMYLTDANYDQRDDQGKFFKLIMDSLKAGDWQTYQSYFVPNFFEGNDTFEKMTPQKLYDIDIYYHSQSQNVTMAGVTYDVVENFTVRYKILNNDGTYRNDLPSDTWKPQIFQIAKTNAGYRIVNVLTVLTGAK